MMSAYSFIAQRGYWGVCANDEGNVLLVHGDGTELSWEALEAAEVGGEYWPATLPYKDFLYLQDHVDQWVEDQVEDDFFDEDMYTDEEDIV